MIFGNNIKKLRELYNMSQKDIADIAGVTNKAVSSWEVEGKEPRMGAVEKIAAHFGLRKSNLIEEDGLNNVDPISLQIKENYPEPGTPITVLSQEELDFIQRMRKVSPIGKTMLVDTLTYLEKVEKIK